MVSVIVLSWLVWAYLVILYLWLAYHCLRNKVGHVSLRLAAVFPLLLIESLLAVIYYRLSQAALILVPENDVTLLTATGLSLWSGAAAVTAYFTVAKNGDPGWWILLAVIGTLIAGLARAGDVPGSVVLWSMGLGLSTWARAILLVPYKLYAGE